MRKMDKVLLLIAFTSLPGCNTMEAAGTDIKKAGQALEESANNAKQEKQRANPTSCPPYQPLYR